MKSEKISNIMDFSPGCVVYDEFTIDDGREGIEHVDRLSEDLLQVKFPGDVLLDLGWYPAFNHERQF